MNPGLVWEKDQFGQNWFIWSLWSISVWLTQTHFSLLRDKIMLSPLGWIQWVGLNVKAFYFIFVHAKLVKLDIRHFFSRSGWYSLSIQDDFILLFLVIWIYIRRNYFCLSLFVFLVVLFIYSFFLFSFLYFHVHDGMIRKA